MPALSSERYVAIVGHWRSVGLSPRAVHLLAYHGLASVGDIRAFGEEALKLSPKCGCGTLGEIGDAVGGWAIEWRAD